MFVPWNDDYEDTKSIKLGQKRISFPSDLLAQQISETYDVNVLNIGYSVIAPTNQPRINVVCEFNHEVAKFRGDGSYSREKQQNVKDSLREILTASRRLNFFERTRCWFRYRKFLMQKAFVIFTPFAPDARSEANAKISENQILQLKRELDDKHLWKISRSPVGGTGATFFFYSDEQAKRAEEQGKQDDFAERFFELLKMYDQFGYIKRDSFSVLLDSKENFDGNYESNWYYYYK